MMNWMRDTVLTLPRFLSTFLVLFALIFIKIFHKLWWTPTRIQKYMASQGISGPSYRLIHGNNKEISNMLEEARSKPIRNLSHDVLSAVQPHIHSWTKTYGKNFLQWQGLQPVLFITEPELCKEILINKDRVYTKKKPNIYSKKLFGDGISVAEDCLKNMIPDMIASSETMLEGWKKHEGKEIEVYEQFRLFTSEVISRTAFGSCYLEGKNMFDMLMKLSSIIFRNSHKLRVPGISKVYKPSDEKESDKLEKGIWDSIIKIRISLNELVEECKTFYFAGQRPLTLCLFGLSFFCPSIPIGKRKREGGGVLQLFEEETPNPGGLAKLKTMSMIMNESLRLYPPAVLLLRKVDKEVRLGNLIVPANVQLHIPTLALHHEPQFWGQDVKLFKPERFFEVRPQHGLQVILHSL
ncbi:hypothetical protein M0R45_019637 [Rubus argutus]|uniref:Cytochrome P450 n=1 Tax=Rubus argutus TaxID=59490 RepID=A0AAW1X8Q6_RUBAR